MFRDVWISSTQTNLGNKLEVFYNKKTGLLAVSLFNLVAELNVELIRINNVNEKEALAQSKMKKGRTKQVTVLDADELRKENAALKAQLTIARNAVASAEKKLAQRAKRREHYAARKPDPTQDVVVNADPNPSHPPLPPGTPETGSVTNSSAVPPGGRDYQAP